MHNIHRGLAIAPLATSLGLALMPLGMALIALPELISGAIHVTALQAIANLASSMFAGLIVGALIGIPVAYVITYVAAWPAIVWMQRRGWVRWWQILMLGAVMGMLPFLLYGVGTVLMRFTAPFEFGFEHEFFGFTATFRRTLEYVRVEFLHFVRLLATGAWCGIPPAFTFWWVALKNERRDPADEQI